MKKTKEIEKESRIIYLCFIGIDVPQCDNIWVKNMEF